MYIPQKQLSNLSAMLAPGKVCVIYGSRRVGKTTLLKVFLKSITYKYLFVSGDDITVRDWLESQSIQKLKDFVGENKLLVVDEAQRIRQIGLNLKIIVDHIPGIQVIATGSSSFDLARDIGEPLTGRKSTLKLYPLAQMELSELEERHETASKLESRLIYGSFPEVVLSNNKAGKEDYLNELANSYLFKDIPELEGIRHADKLIRLLQLIAFQIGKEVSLNELGTQLGMSKNTVEKYLDLLEKTFVIFKRKGYSRNLRNTISKNHRYYFFDTGIRNVLINNFNPLNLRDDVGVLWENYIVAERMKRNEYTRNFLSSYFWRTYSRAEIDLVEEQNTALKAFEIKFTPKKLSAPAEWKKHYPNATFEIISKDNYLDFIC